MKHLRLATRGSPLARLQATTIARLLEHACAELSVEIVVVTTRGDRFRSVPSDEIPGGPGVFTKEVEDAVLSGLADVAVHSAKDLPTRLSEGLVIGAVPDRIDHRDALVGLSLADLPAGAVVATDSPRRRAQLLWHRPDLGFTLLRGNIDTRLARLGEGVDALVLAMAGLIRLGHDSRPDVYPLSSSEVMPAMGQGALAVEARADDVATRDLLASIDMAVLHDAVAAERTAIRTLEGGCRSPSGALAREGRIEVAVAAPDGSYVLRMEGPQEDAEAIALSLLDAEAAG